jgi:hypothetical protein
VYSEANIREKNFSANFPSVSIFQCEASGRSPLAFGRVRLRRPDGQMTRLDAHCSVECFCGIPRPNGLMMRQDRHPKGIKIAFQP